MSNSLLIRTIKDPILVKQFSAEDWGILLSQTRVSQISLYILAMMEAKQLTAYIPRKVLSHWQGEKYRVAYQKRQIIFELSRVKQAFIRKKIPAIYLKGTAYILANLPIANWRIFSDIDILVNKQDIQKAELALKIAGFASQKTNDYDQQYYRQHMHEIPPMQHIERGTILDVHHNILPISAKNPIDISQFNSKSHLDLLGLEYNIFPPHAMYLHAAIHLFHEGEFDKGLRDLCDLAIMYKEFSEQDPLFDELVISLAQKVCQEKVLYFAFKYSEKLLSVSLNLNAANFVVCYQSTYKYSTIADFIFYRVLLPHHDTCATKGIGVAKLLAYIRGHLLRMPLKLLIPHLVKKAWMQLKEDYSDDKSAEKEQPHL